MHAFPKQKNPQGEIVEDKNNRGSFYDDPPLPELIGPDEPRLVEALFEAGPTMAGGMGEVPLSWQEIDAYARQAQTISEPWEARTLARMSAAYLEGRAIGENIFGIMPMEKEV